MNKLSFHYGPVKNKLSFHYGPVKWKNKLSHDVIDFIVMQNCINFIANALELLQSCTKPLIYDKPW